jgi:hypothetical protein
MKKKSLRCLFVYLLLVLSIPSITYGKTIFDAGDYDQQIETINLKADPNLQFIDENLGSYAQLIAIFSSFKEMDISFGNQLLQKVQIGDPLTGDEVYNLRKTITTYYKINQKILDFAKVYKVGSNIMPKDFASGKDKLSETKAHMIYLTGQLLVLEHLVSMHKIYYDTDPVFRRIVKHALLDKENASTGPSKNLNDLIKMSQYTVEVGDSAEFSKQIILVRSIEKDLKNILENNTEALSLLNIIVTNPVATIIAQGKNNFKANYFYFIDTFIDFFNELTNWLSSIFGNIAGSISWRNGHLKNDPKALALIASELRPMDIIFDKSPFILTDLFIPGFFDHVGLYLGTEEQLKSIGMWDHPSLVPYQTEIRKGHVILEAVRPVVHLNSLQGFMNIDTYMLIRKEDGLGSPDLLIDQITRGMDQMGKPYDFNFDVQTLDKIVCSELIYIVFGNVHWPTKYRLGRTTIAPDDIAEIIFHRGSKFHLKTFMNSNVDNMFGLYTIEKVASEMGYVSKLNEPGYFKLTTKCYKDSNNRRTCQSTYTQKEYEEH